MVSTLFFSIWQMIVGSRRLNAKWKLSKRYITEHMCLAKKNLVKNEKQANKFHVCNLRTKIWWINWHCKNAKIVLSPVNQWMLSIFDQMPSEIFFTILDFIHARQDSLVLYIYFKYLMAKQSIVIDINNISSFFLGSDKVDS